MKKIVSLIIMIFILAMSITTVNAADEVTKKIDVNLTGETLIKKDTKEIVLTLSLGEFIGIPEDEVLGYQTSLVYDKDIFESVTVKGSNGWTASYAESTGVLIGDVATAKANSEITKITLTVKNDVKLGITGKIQLDKLELTDGTNDFSFNKEVTVTVEEEKKEENTNTSNNTNTANRINGTNTDKTLSQSKLPAAGIKNVLIIAIATLAVITIVFKIKSRKIRY